MLSAASVIGGDAGKRDSPLGRKPASAGANVATSSICRAHACGGIRESGTLATGPAFDVQQRPAEGGAKAPVTVIEKRPRYRGLFRIWQGLIQVLTAGTAIDTSI